MPWPYARPQLGCTAQVGCIFGRETDMKWQLAGDWPVGPAVIPAGTVLTGVVGPDGELVVSPPLTAPLPLNAVALDEEAASIGATLTTSTNMVARGPSKNIARGFLAKTY